MKVWNILILKTEKGWKTICRLWISIIVLLPARVLIWFGLVHLTYNYDHSKPTNSIIIILGIFCFIIVVQTSLIIFTKFVSHFQSHTLKMLMRRFYVLPKLFKAYSFFFFFLIRIVLTLTLGGAARTCT